MNRAMRYSGPSRTETFKFLAELVSRHSTTTAMAVMRGTTVPPEAKWEFEAELRKRGFLEEGEELRGTRVGEILEQVAPENAR